jgi:hypothetical protein
MKSYLIFLLLLVLLVYLRRCWITQVAKIVHNFYSLVLHLDL